MLPTASVQDMATAGSTAVVYFNEVAQAYASMYGAPSSNGYALRERQQRVLELIDPPRGKVLDVGCGPGFLAQELLSRGIEVWGVDAAPKMIEECRRRLGHHDQAHFAVGDVTRLEFPDGVFDTVICLGVLDYISPNGAAIRELVRVVKREGTVLVSFPNLLSPYAAWKRFVFYPGVRWFRPLYYRLTRRAASPVRPLHITKMYTVRDAAALLARHGAALAGVTYYNFNIFLSPLDEVAPSRILGALERLERLRGGTLKWLGAGFIARGIKVGTAR